MSRQFISYAYGSTTGQRHTLLNTIHADGSVTFVQVGEVEYPPFRDELEKLLHDRRWERDSYGQLKRGSEP